MTIKRSSKDNGNSNTSVPHQTHELFEKCHR
jgi:hypothetical protein